MPVSPYITVCAGLLLAPLLPGVINRVKAVFAGRRGPPLLQLYFDLWKLLRKGAVYSRSTSWVLKLAPSVGLGAVLMALSLVPAPGAPAMFGFDGSLFVFLGLLALARFAMIVAALDTGSAFEGMGASREALYGALTEPILLLVLAGLTSVAGTRSLGELFREFFEQATQPSIPAIGLLAVALLVVTLAENCRIPFDDPETHLELTMIHEVMILDYSGPDLAFVFYASALKLWIFGALLVCLLVPLHDTRPDISAVALYAGEFGMALVIGVLESVMARLRLVKAPQLLVVALTLAALGLVLLLRSLS
jgi:formate hydrogenlyase subunit 4